MGPFFPGSSASCWAEPCYGPNQRGCYLLPQINGPRLHEGKLGCLIFVDRLWRCARPPARNPSSIKHAKQLSAAWRARRRPTTAAVTDQQEVLTLLTPLVIVFHQARGPWAGPKHENWARYTARPGTEVNGPGPARHGRRAMPGPRLRHVGRPGPARLASGPTRHVGRPVSTKPTKPASPSRPAT